MLRVENWLIFNWGFFSSKNRHFLKPEQQNLNEDPWGKLNQIPVKKCGCFSYCYKNVCYILQIVRFRLADLFDLFSTCIYIYITFLFVRMLFVFFRRCEEYGMQRRSYQLHFWSRTKLPLGAVVKILDKGDLQSELV